SPGGAFWSVSVHEPSADPATLAKAAVDAIQEEYSHSEVDVAQDAIEGREMIGYDVSFYYLDLISTASIRCWRADRATYVVFSQAEDRELDQIRNVFHAMTTSLVRGLKPIDR
ncbi:MAG: hypothetical protein ACYTG0_40500, partial [Planctomycetota bacterium]